MTSPAQAQLLALKAQFLKSVNMNDANNDLYRYVALIAVLMVFHFALTGFLAAGRARSKVFTEDFMKQNFETIHNRHFPEGHPSHGVPKGGYPDAGSGRYSDKLSYKEWFEFNVGQRIHYHYLESITSVVLFLLVAGLKYPVIAIASGSVYILGRIIFHLGYSFKGPNGRVVGLIIQNLSAMVLMIFAFVSPIQIATG